MVTLELADGRTLSGRIVARDEQITRIATDLMRPTASDVGPQWHGFANPLPTRFNYALRAVERAQ
jgi:hypothetical protein